jgi:hypothetical protein
MCTVLVRLEPGAAWPVQLGAVRDEFVERDWDPPAAHWAGPWAHLVGGRDRRAGGTWLAVDPTPGRPAVAAVLNGGRREELPDGAARPTRGELALRVLAGDGVPEGDEVQPYDRFHLLRCDLERQDLWSWDGETLVHHRLEPDSAGPRHLIVVNTGLDDETDPLVPHFGPLFAQLADGADQPQDTWSTEAWTALLTGDGLPGDDPRALLVAKEIEGHAYGSTSAALVALAADGRLRYDFTAIPADPASWQQVL